MDQFDQQYFVYQRVREFTGHLNAEAALADFDRYLELLPDGKDRETVEEWIAELEAQVSEP